MDRQYVELTKQLESGRLHRFSVERKDLTRRRKSVLKKLKEKKLRQVVSDWTRNQALSDVERQIRGEDITQDDDPEPEAPPMTDIQRRVFEALTAPLVNDIEAQFKRRSTATKVLVEYCGEEEPLRTKILESRNSEPVEDLESTKRSVFVETVQGGRVRRCFLCVAKAFQLGQRHRRFYELCHNFYDHSVVARHLISVHLDGIDETARYDCPLCHVTLIHKDHLRLHAKKVHGINTSGKRKMKCNGN
ncbi:putative c2h2 finger domain-containing protein [Diaporthe ampelina]|uniref:Putative c2h2 finger domain-containing protein n=1 Tax=Diaporthe ampelina TaxID=1214573 RepID=A0A0G2F9N0_9PEZI|nr:putative c2h2 finger domain-containing protein [Diaporthe ampelina]